MLVPARRWLWRGPLTVVFVLLLLIYLVHSTARQDRSSPIGTNGYDADGNSLLERRQEFWRLLHSHIVENEPRCSPVAHSEIGDLSIHYDESGISPNRPDRLNISATQLHELRSQHRAFASTLRREQFTLPFVAKTRGIVTTAGGKYLPVAVVSVRMLRETNCKLPVEVFLGTQNEWDSEICDDVFPVLNARCVVLADTFGAVHHESPVDIDKYQYSEFPIKLGSG